jgi:hypothetical protein
VDLHWKNAQIMTVVVDAGGMEHAKEHWTMKIMEQQKIEKHVACIGVDHQKDQENLLLVSQHLMMQKEQENIIKKTMTKTKIMDMKFGRKIFMMEKKLVQDQLIMEMIDQTNATLQLDARSEHTEQ